MAAPFHHLRGERVWLRCDHQGTRLHGPTASVRLALTEVEDRVPPEEDGDGLADPGSERLQQWAPRVTGAVRVELDPAACPPQAPGADALQGDPAGQLLLDSGEGWMAFPTGLGGLLSLCRDPCGRLFLLETEPRVVHVRSARTLAWLDRFDAPPLTRHIAATDAGLYATDGTDVFYRPHGGSWSPALGGALLTPAGHRVRVVNLAASGDRVVLLARSARRAWLGELTPKGRGSLHGIELDDPLPLLVLPDGSVLVGELDAPPGGLCRFTRYTCGTTGPSPEEEREVVGYDGRGLVALPDLSVLASTPTGYKRLYRVRQTFVPEGRLETFALDSERFGCVWHRVFLDVCLPPETSISVDARSSDTLVPDALLRAPRPPEGVGPEDMLAGPPPLGSRTADDEEGWIPVGVLDEQALYIDLAWPGRGEPPSDDPYTRCNTMVQAADCTLEGLLKNPGGRYLWLRVKLQGTRHSSPVLSAIRAWFPRPSMLAYLPAWWRADPEAAARMDELLALFEAVFTRMADRVDTLHRLFDPRITPPEALSWLASFLALRFDDRLSEAVRRQLLAETAVLYRQRGTVPGLERLCSILSEGPARVIEAWRLRRRHGSLLGVLAEDNTEVPATVLGAGMQLGGRSEDPSAGAHDDAVVRGFFDKYAHRFSVLIFRDCEPDLQAVLEAAIALAKPAHTVHEICWVGAGLRVGANSYVGVGTVAGPTNPAWPPARVGQPGFVLGGATLGAADPATLTVPSSHSPSARDTR